MGWQVTFEGVTYRESDLTMAMAAQALEVAGGDWAVLHPLRSPDHFCALLAVFLEAAGEDFDDALLRVSALKLVDALAMISTEEPSHASA